MGLYGAQTAPRPRALISFEMTTSKARRGSATIQARHTRSSWPAALCVSRSFPVCPQRPTQTDFYSRSVMINLDVVSLDKLNTGTSHESEIAPRSRTHTQAIQRRYNLVDGAEHPPEISTTPGMAMRRRSEREWQYLAHGCSKPFWGSFTRGRPASRADPLRQMLPFSLRSAPPSHPGRCGYLRGMFCALSYSKTPLDGLGAGTRSRGNLACI